MEAPIHVTTVPKQISMEITKLNYVHDENGENYSVQVFCRRNDNRRRKYNDLEKCG